MSSEEKENFMDQITVKAETLISKAAAASTHPCPN